MNALSRGDLTIGWKRNQNLASLNKTGFNRYIQEDKVTTGNLVLSGALLFQLTCHILGIYFSPQTVTFSLESFHLTSWIFLEMQKILTKISSHFWNGKKFCKHGPFCSCQLHSCFPLVCVCLSKKKKSTWEFTTFLSFCKRKLILGVPHISSSCWT